MHHTLFALTLAFLLIGCRQSETAAAPPAGQPAPAAGQQPAASKPTSTTAHLRVTSGGFVAPDGREWTWNGITAFRLLELVAHKREADAGAYLDWASKRGLTIVRVLAMARHLFELDPAAGRAALPRLLEMAAGRGIYVEVVALADTASFTMDIEAHVKEIAAICAKHPNAILELANEPYHATQTRRVHDVAYLEQLHRLADEHLPVALGAGDGTDDYPGADFITVHFQRTNRLQGWGPVLELVKGVELSKRHGKPVVDDEPIGAGPVAQPGRREADPEKFRAMGLVSRLLGLGATFHYEGGLQARIPGGVEAACFDAWLTGRTALTSLTGQVIVVEPGSKTSGLRQWDRGRVAGVLEVRRGERNFLVLLGVSGDPALALADGWRQAAAQRWPSVWLLTLTQ